MKKPFQVFGFNIQNTGLAETVTVHIDGEIVDASTQEIMKSWFGDETSTSYKSFRNQLDKLTFKTLDVIINSPGGHVGDALAMHDYLVDLQSKNFIVNTIGRGIVASSATLILLAGKNPSMSSNSFFMMHTVSGGIYGTVDQVENYAKTMRTFNNMIRDLYAERSGMRKEDITKLMDEETWLSAKDAETKGFVKRIDSSAVFTNHIDKEFWNYSNTDVLNIYNQSVKSTTADQTIEDMKQIWTKLATDLQNALKAIQPAPSNDAAGHNTLMANIAEAIAKPFEGIDFETEINNAVTARLASKDVTDAIALQVTNATSAFTAQIAALTKKNDDLVEEIANKMGNAGSGGNGNGGVKPIGSFN